MDFFRCTVLFLELLFMVVDDRLLVCQPAKKRKLQNASIVFINFYNDRIVNANKRKELS